MEHRKLLKASKKNLLKLIFSRTTIVVLLLLLNFCLLFSFLLGLLEGLPAYLGSMVVFTGIVLLYVLNTDANPSIKLSWCILIAILPLFGTALYFYVKSDLGHRMVKGIVNASVEESLEHLPAADIPADVPDIAHYLNRHGHAQCYAHSDARYFPLGAW